jgi:hypothetical protein
LRVVAEGPRPQAKKDLLYDLLDDLTIPQDLER